MSNQQPAQPPPFIRAQESRLGPCPSCGREVKPLQGAGFSGITHDLPQCELFEELKPHDFVTQMMRQRRTGKIGRA